MPLHHAAGNPALAVELSRGVIALTPGARNERSFSDSRMNLVRAAPDVDDRTLARATLQAGWPGALTDEQLYRHTMADEDD